MARAFLVSISCRGHCGSDAVAERRYWIKMKGAGHYLEGGLEETRSVARCSLGHLQDRAGGSAGGGDGDRPSCELPGAVYALFSS